MKLSANPRSRFYVPDLIGNNLILLNGEEVKYCVLANEDDGFVIRHKLDENGEFVITDGEWLTYEKVCGDVKIVDTRSHVDTRSQ